MAALSTTHGRRLGAGTGGFHHAGRVLSRLLESGFYETSPRGGPHKLQETRV